MLYISLDATTIKIMAVKKGLIGQYDTSFFSKVCTTELLQEGLPASVDILASSIKETISLLAESALKDKEVVLVLPQSVFVYHRIDIPVDVTDAVLSSYVKEKVRTESGFDMDTGVSDWIVRDHEGVKKIIFYGIKEEVMTSLTKAFSLLGLTIQHVIPATLSYFTLFEKTLRSNKKEHIWYVTYDHNLLSGCVFDSYGLLNDTKWSSKITDSTIEKILAKKTAEYETANIKLNRLILSGPQSETVRQDTFTKHVGVWTNPLKRIIPHFYADYLKMLAGQDGKEVPILAYDMLFGAFVFLTEQKTFSLMKKKGTKDAKQINTKERRTLPSLKVPSRGILLALISFVVTFSLLFVVSRVNFKSMSFSLPSFSFSLPSVPNLAQSTPTPTPSPVPPVPTPTPTPAIDKATVRVSILNGSGIKGKASVVKSFLNKKGYEEILTANADAFDYEITVIQTKKGNTQLQTLVAQDIASELVDKPTFETLEDDDPADVVIIVGTDFR